MATPVVFKIGTRAQYNALQEKNPNALYFLTDTKEIYRGADGLAQNSYYEDIKTVLTEDTIMYRVSGGTAGKVGSYLSRTSQGGGLQTQLDLALNPAWGNTTENVTRVVVPKGTSIYEGFAAPQNIYDSFNNVIGTLPGGGNQVYIPKVDARWFR